MPTTTTNSQRSTGPTGVEAARSAAVTSADHLAQQHVQEETSGAGPEGLRRLWNRLRLTVAEMNYAANRLADPRVR
jgi:hypothetical protein